MTRSDDEVAEAAAAAGAAVVRARYGEPLVRHAKSATDFATDVDLAAERAILDVLARERPADARIGEEHGASGDADGRRRWLVDPLCGTLNFAAETPLVAVNVALQVDGRTTVGVVVDPLTGDTWTTAAPPTPGAASTLVDINCDGPTDRPFVGGGLVADPALRKAFGPRVLSTTLALAWVADGRRAAYVTDGDGAALTRSVHFAAGIAVCRAAGCVVTDLRGAPLEGGRGLLVAADATTHAELVDLVRPHLGPA
ncbi:inositol monophosphatase family protein [Nocardioides ginsengisoli]|uniref:Inositol monophosphatase n=1 Tax=Nocardioides ginsengisoli TaxID=363868 RepID=A0ABW3W0Z0_9ACTN